MSKHTDPTVSRMELTLVVRRTIGASPERVFDAWTKPERLRLWWGPRGVTCTAAEVDLRVGGRYRIANQFPGAITQLHQASLFYLGVILLVIGLLSNLAAQWIGRRFDIAQRGAAR